MGFYSFKVNGKSISNRFSSLGTEPVVMIDDKDNRFLEEDYEGYGVFGDKDYLVLLAEMNGLSTRDEGLELAFSDKPHLRPRFYFASEGKLSYKDLKDPESCEYQGFFY